MSNEKVIFESGVNLNGAISDLEKLSNKFRDNRILVEKLRGETSKYKKQLKELSKSEESQTTEGKKRYAALIDKINESEQSLRQARQTQRELNKEYDKLKLPTNSMAKLRAETNSTQKALDRHVRGVTIAADKYDEMKESVEKNRLAIINYDQSINDGRTNVGRYAQSLQGIKSKFDQILGVSAGLGGAISGIFALDGAISAIGDFNEKIKETTQEQKQVNIAFSGSQEQLQNYRAEIKAVANALDVEFNETLNASNQLTSRFGTDANKAIGLVATGLDNVKDKSGFLSLVNEDLKKFVDLGIDDKSAIALLTQASNLGINPDVFAEPLIKLREATPSTVDALVAAFGEKKTNEIFETFKKSPIEAIQLISSEMGGLDSRTSEYGALLADVFSSSGEDDVAVATALHQIDMGLGQVSERTQRALEVQQDYEAAMSELSTQLIGTSDSFQLMKDKIMVLIIQGLLNFINIIKATPKFIQENKTTIIALLVAIAAFNFQLIKSNALLLKDIAAKKLQAIWTTRSTVRQWSLNAAFSANPIGIVIGLVAGLIAVFAYLYTHSEQVKNGIDNLTNRFLNFYEKNLLVKAALFGIIEPIKGIIKVFRGAINGGESFRSAISSIIVNVQERFNRLGLSAQRLGKRMQLGLTVNPAARDNIRKELRSIENEFEASRKRVQAADAKLEKTIADAKKTKSDNKANATKKDDFSLKGNRGGGSTGSGTTSDAEAKAKETAQRKIAVQKKIEDLQIKLLQDGTQKRIAELELRSDREIAAIEVTGEQKTTLEKLIREQLANDIAKVQTDADKKASEESKKLTEKNLQDKLKQLELGFEEEKTLLTEQFANGQVTKQELDGKLLSAQIEFTNKKLALSTKGSQEELALRQELSNLIIEEDKRAKEASVTLIDDYYNEQSIKQLEAFESQKIALQEQYLQGQISYQDYQMGLGDIEELHRQEQLKAKAEHIQQLMELEAGNGDDIGSNERQAELLSQLRAVEKESYDLAIEQHKRFEEEKTRVSEEQNQNRLAVAKAGLDFLKDLNDAILQSELKRAGDDEVAKKKAQRKAAARGKVLSVTQATINTFEAATKAMASAPPPFGQILAGIAVAAGLANVAKIVSTPLPKLAKGGYFPNYRTHSEGGTVVEMAKHEMAVTPNAGKNRKARSLTSYINSSFGGVSYPMTEQLPSGLRDDINSYLGRNYSIPSRITNSVSRVMAGVRIPKMQRGGFNDGRVANQTAGVNKSVNVKADQQMELLRRQNDLLAGILQKEGKISIDELGQASKRQNTYQKYGRA